MGAPRAIGLQQRAILLVIGVLVALILIVAGSVLRVLQPGFDDIEQGETRKDRARAVKAFHHSASSLERTASDWAWFDDMWTFMEQGTPGFLEANANQQTMVNVDVDLLAYVRLDGSLLFAHHIAADQRLIEGLPTGAAAWVTGAGDFAQAGPNNESRDGLVSIDGHPMFLSARPILRSDKSGDPRGTLIVGRFVDQGEQRRLSEETELSITFRPPPATPLAEPEPPCEITEDTLRCVNVVQDRLGEPALLLELTLDRGVHQQSVQTIRTFGAVLLALAALLFGGMSLFVHNQIIGPVLRLSRRLSTIAATQRWDDRVDVEHIDELGALARDLNHLLAQVDDSQRKLRVLNEELEDKVSARTRELAEANAQLRRDIELRKRLERQLQVAQKLESLGIMAGGVAHDFNNYLSTIRGNVALAMELLSLDHPARKRLEVAERGGERARQLTAQLLDLASGESGSPAEVNLEVAYRDLLSTLDFPAGVAAVIDFPADLPDVLCDPRQLQQVLHNLVQNAVQAMPEGGIVRATAAFVGAERPLPLATCPPGLLFVRITISDEGVGIPEDGLARIFDPYVTTKKTGTGLGLTLCWTIVRRHGGVLTVESTVGQGTSFHVFLPAAS